MGIFQIVTGRKFKNPLAVTLIFLMVFAVVAMGSLSPAQAQQTDADFSAYCRANFDNSTYQRIPQSWGTEHVCVQGGTRQGIDLAEACFLTTGSRRYQVSGARVLCEGSPGDAPLENTNDLGAPDFSLYCRENFPNSVYEKGAQLGKTVHYCRIPGTTGGFTLQPVDLAEACALSFETPEYRVSGDRIFCTSENASGPGAGGKGGPAPLPAPMPAPRPAPKPAPGPAPGPNPGPNPGPGDEPGPEPDAEQDPAPTSATPDSPTSSSYLCLDPESGQQVDWPNGSIADIEQILSRYQACSDGSCSAPEQNAFQAYMSIFMIFQCHAGFLSQPDDKAPEDLIKAKDELCLTILPVLNSLGPKTGGMGGLHREFLKGYGLQGLCN